MANNLLKAVFLASRPPFLVLTPACVFLGIATAVCAGAEISILHATLALLGGLCAHISVNTFNEYCDFNSGLDATTDKTPFSGGSGALVATPAALAWVKNTALLTLTITSAIGVYFLTVAGPAIVPIGLVGLVLIVVYTQWLNKVPWLCLIAPGLGFGPLMVIGSDSIFTGEVSWLAVQASLVPFFLVNNLLLLNQFPDIEADRAVGRNHFPIAYGINASIWMFGCFVLAATASLIALALHPLVNLWCLLGLIPLSAQWLAFVGAHKHGTNIARLLPFMGLNVAASVLTPAIVAALLLL